MKNFKHVITVSDEGLAEAIRRGIKLWWPNARAIVEKQSGEETTYSVQVVRVVKDSDVAAMNAYARGAFDSSKGRLA